MAPILRTHVDPRSELFAANREALLAALAEIDGLYGQLTAGGGTADPDKNARTVARHRARGKLLPRERISLLLDRGAAFLELSPLAGWGTDDAVGAGLVTGIGRINGVECMVSANDPTVKGGSQSPITVTKALRAMEIARENRLPLVSLTESGGADLTKQADVFNPGGASFKNLTRLSAAGIPTITLVFGSSTAGGAYVPGMSDYVVLQKDAARVYLGGPPLVKMAIDEDADDETLGGAEMHARTSGLADYLALDEPDALRIGRDIVGHLNWRKAGPGPSLARAPSALRPRGAARHRLGRHQGPVRGARGARPHARRQRVRRVQAAVRHDAGDRLGPRQRLPGRHPRQQRHPVQRGGPQGRPVHPAVQPDGRADPVPAEHHRLHGRHPVRAGRHHQGRREAHQRRVQLRRPDDHAHDGRLVRRRATTAWPGAPTTRGSSSAGPTTASR